MHIELPHMMISRHFSLSATTLIADILFWISEVCTILGVSLISATHQLSGETVLHTYKQRQLCAAQKGGCFERNDPPMPLLSVSDSNLECP